MNINVDLSDVVQEFKLIESNADIITQNVIDAVSAEIYRQWQNAARQSLNSTRNGYINGLQWYQEGYLRNAIVLNGTFNNMLEDGFGAYDMKQVFQQSGKVKNVKRKDGSTGWYLTIPFRQATPGAIGENVAFSGVLPDEIYREAKKLKAGRSTFGGKKSGGARLSVPISSKYSIPKSRRAFSDAKTQQQYPEYKHKSGPYEGLTRTSETYGRTSQSTYTTFRRASDRSDPQSWIHRGITAYNLSQKALESTDIETVKNNAIDSTLTSFGL